MDGPSSSLSLSSMVGEKINLKMAQNEIWQLVEKQKWYLEW